MLLSIPDMFFSFRAGISTARQTGAAHPGREERGGSRHRRRQQPKKVGEALLRCGLNCMDIWHSNIDTERSLH